MVLPTSPIWQLGQENHAVSPAPVIIAGSFQAQFYYMAWVLVFCRLVQNTPKTGHAKEACSVTWRLGLPKSAREKRTILVRRKSHRH